MTNANQYLVPAVAILAGACLLAAAGSCGRAEDGAPQGRRLGEPAERTPPPEQPDPAQPRVPDEPRVPDDPEPQVPDEPEVPQVPDEPETPETPDEPKETAEGPDGTEYEVISKRELDSGLVIEELKIGEGPECPRGATVVIHYHGTLADGTVFDTTRGDDPRGPWPLERLIAGWQEGVPGMRIGGVRRLTVPPELGYGPGGAGPIPPNATLTFSIELVEVR